MLPNPYPALPELRRATSCAARFGMDGPTLAFAGRLGLQKSLDVALAAVEAVDGVSLVIAGDGDERARLEALAGAAGALPRRAVAAAACSSCSAPRTRRCSRRAGRTSRTRWSRRSRWARRFSPRGWAGWPRSCATARTDCSWSRATLARSPGASAASSPTTRCVSGCGLRPPESVRGIRPRDDLRSPGAGARGRGAMSAEASSSSAAAATGCRSTPQLARKWDALAAEMDIRVLGGGGPTTTAASGSCAGGRRAFYLSLPLHVARELRVVPAGCGRRAEPVRGSGRARRAGARTLTRTRRRRGARRLGHGDPAVRLAAAPARRAGEPRRRADGGAPLGRGAHRVAVHELARARARRRAGGDVHHVLRRLGVHGVAAGSASRSSRARSSSACSSGTRTCTGSPTRGASLRPASRGDAPPDRARARARRCRGPRARLPRPRHVGGAGAVRRPWPPRSTRRRVFVLPSFSEGLPRVAMEAFARGRSVVGARAGGIPDIVEDGRQRSARAARRRARRSRTRSCACSPGPRISRSRSPTAPPRGRGPRWLQTPEEFAAHTRELVDAVQR